MNLNLITKTQLRDFVDLKIRTRKSEIHKEIKVIANDRLGAALQILLGDLTALEKAASKFEDLLTAKIHLIGADTVPEQSKTTASHANKLCKAQNYFLEEVVSKALRALENPRESYYTFKCEPLTEVFNALNAELQPKLKLLRNGLETLKTELNNAISNEPTGKRGYSALVALGMDMSDLPEANPNLPSVIKLSVDVCVLNGNCEQKVG